MVVTVKELKKWLNKCDDNTKIIINYTCSDDWYNYYGTIEEIEFDDDTDLILKINNY